jgi:hypothetical protein
MKYVPRTVLYSFSHVCQAGLIEYEVTAEVVRVAFRIHVQGGGRGGGGWRGDTPTSILDNDTRSR